MKLAKKMLASAVALVMVAALALTAFAATPAVTMTATDAIVGETVTITVSGKDIAGLESADLQFNYDATALEYVSVEQAAGASFSLAVGGNPEAGMVTFSFAFVEAATADSDICTLTFKVLKAGSSDVTLTYNSWDGAEQPADVTLTVTGAEAPTEVEPDDDNNNNDNQNGGDQDKIPQTGEAGIAAIAGVMAIAAVAFVATRKKDEE